MSFGQIHQPAHERRRYNALGIVANQDTSTFAQERLGGPEDHLFICAIKRGRDLLVHPNHLLVVGNDPCLYRGRSPGAGDDAADAYVLALKVALDPSPHLVITQQPAHFNLASKGEDIVSHIGGSPEPQCLVGDPYDRHGSLWGNPGYSTPDVFVDHQVTDDEDLTVLQGRDKFIASFNYIRHVKSPCFRVIRVKEKVPCPTIWHRQTARLKRFESPCAS